MKLYVGIDVSSEKLDVCVLDSEDTILKECTLPNDLNGASILKPTFWDLQRKLLTLESSQAWNPHPCTASTPPPSLRKTLSSKPWPWKLSS